MAWSNDIIKVRKKLKHFPIPRHLQSQSCSPSQWFLKKFKKGLNHFPVFCIKYNFSCPVNSCVAYMYGLCLLFKIFNDLFFYFIQVIIFFFLRVTIFVESIRDDLYKNRKRVLRLVFEFFQIAIDYSQRRETIYFKFKAGICCSFALHNCSIEL